MNYTTLSYVFLKWFFLAVLHASPSFFIINMHHFQNHGIAFDDFLDPSMISLLVGPLLYVFLFTIFEIKIAHSKYENLMRLFYFGTIVRVVLFLLFPVGLIIEFIMGGIASFVGYQIFHIFLPDSQNDIVIFTGTLLVTLIQGMLITGEILLLGLIVTSATKYYSGVALPREKLWSVPGPKFTR